MIKEIWKKVKGVDKRYDISNFGRVRSYCGKKAGGEIIKGQKKSGYLSVDMSVKGKPKSFYIHHLVAKCFLPKTGPRADKIIHVDGNNLNNHVRNLKWVTQSEINAKIEKQYHTLARSAHKRSRVTSAADPVVKKILLLAEMNVPKIQIAGHFNMSPITLNTIIKKFGP